MNQSLSRFQQVLAAADRRFVLATVAALAVAAGLLVGAAVAVLSPIYAVAGAVALVAAVLMLRDTQWGFIALIGIICLLPFGALPFKIGFTPTFLDLALLALYFVWLMRIAAGKARGLLGGALGLPTLVFLLLACASFIAGLGHASLDQYVLRHFVEVLLGISLYFAVLNCVQSREQLRMLVRVLLLVGFAAAFAGVVLYFLPEAWSIRLLSALGRVGYPTGESVLRYIDDDPSLAQRAISTSTDPNVLGGLLILITTLTAAQFFAVKPLLPRLVVGGMVLTEALCLYLTYSRGSMLGLAAGLVVLVVMGHVRYRRLIPAMAAGLLLLLLLPQAQAYIQRFVEGLQQQDLATQMRLGEYKDALQLIGRHPWLGVGFVGTPETSLYIGVSNVYLLMAEEMGVIGLGVFLLILALFFRTMVKAWSRVASDADLEAIVLGLTASVAGILVGGMLDHYFFNLAFPHSISVFWLYLGLAVAAVNMGRSSMRTEPGATGMAAGAAAA